MATISPIESLEHYPSRTYSDVNFSLVTHPVSLDVTRKINEEAIKQSIKSLCLLGAKEKPFHPEIYGGIYELLFENIEEPGTKELLKMNITRVLTEYEPRVEVLSVDAESQNDNNSVSVTVYFKIINTLVPSKVEFFVKTAR
jgi:phage baseplate assembly protein W